MTYNLYFMQNYIYIYNIILHCTSNTLNYNDKKFSFFFICCVGITRIAIEMLLIIHPGDLVRFKQQFCLIYLYNSAKFEFIKTSKNHNGVGGDSTSIY